MTTAWLLLLVIASYQIIGIQSTSHDDESCEDEGLLGDLDSDIKGILANNQILIDKKREAVRVLSERLTKLELAIAGPRVKDCAALYKEGVRGDGRYFVYPSSPISCAGAVAVYCDMTTDGGGWTVFQRRMDGSVDFYRDWVDYKTGFGNLSGEFWLGNDNLNLLTSGSRQRLRVELEDFEDNARYAQYDNFKVESAAEKYKLSSLGTYTGDAGDSLTPRHLGSMFSTRDQDNDQKDDRSCAVQFKGAWWYEHCHESNLNAQYLGGEHSSYADGVNWLRWKGHRYSLKFTEMKLRPFDF